MEERSALELAGMLVASVTTTRLITEALRDRLARRIVETDDGAPALDTAYRHLLEIARSADPHRRLALEVLGGVHAELCPHCKGGAHGFEVHEGGGEGDASARADLRVWRTVLGEGFTMTGEVPEPGDHLA